MLLSHFKIRRCAEKIIFVGKKSIPLILYAESKTAALTGAAVPRFRHEIFRRSTQQ